MSPGLAKRVTTSPTSNLANDQTPTTCSSSSNSSTNNKKVTIVNPKQQSNNVTNNNNNAQAKIQNALERNMQKLKLQSNKVPKTSNLTREDIELFTSPIIDASKLEENMNNNLTVPLNNASGGYFTSDSLSSTPEHEQIHQLNNNNGIGNKNKHSEVEASKKSAEMAAYLLDRVPLGLNLNSNSKFANSNIGREMTPDSIDNNSTSDCNDTFEPPLNNINRSKIHNHHPPLSQQSNRKLLHHPQHQLLAQSRSHPKQNLPQETQQVKQLKRTQQPTNPTSVSSVSSQNQHQYQQQQANRVQSSQKSLSSSCSSSSSFSKPHPLHQHHHHSHFHPHHHPHVQQPVSSTPSCSSSTSSALSSPIFQQQQQQKLSRHRVIQKPNATPNITGNQLASIVKTTAKSAASSMMNKAFKTNQNYNLVHTNQQLKSVSQHQPIKKHLLTSSNANNKLHSNKKTIMYMSSTCCEAGNKIMPVVEEGLSNDELNDDLEDEDDVYYEDYEEDEDEEDEDEEGEGDDEEYEDEEEINNQASAAVASEYNESQEYEYDYNSEERCEECEHEYEQQLQQNEDYSESEHNVYFNRNNQSSKNKISNSYSDHSMATNSYKITKPVLFKQSQLEPSNQAHQSKLKTQQCHQHNHNVQRTNSTKSANPNLNSSTMYTSSSASSSSSTIKSVGPTTSSHGQAKITVSQSAFSLKSTNNNNDFTKRNEIDYDTDEETNKLLDSNNNNGDTNDKHRVRNQHKSTSSTASSQDDKSSTKVILKILFVNLIKKRVLFCLLQLK